MASLEGFKSRVLSPMAVRSKGHPPFKRKVLKVDEATRKKKKGKSKARWKTLDMGGLNWNTSVDDHLFLGVGTQDIVNPLPDLNGNRYNVTPTHFCPVQLNDSL